MSSHGKLSNCLKEGIKKNHAPSHPLDTRLCDRQEAETGEG